MRVLTKQGYVSLRSVVGKTLEIWDGFAWRLRTVKKCEEDKTLSMCRVILSSGATLTLHKDQKLYAKQRHASCAQYAFYSDAHTKVLRVSDVGQTSLCDYKLPNSSAAESAFVEKVVACKKRKRTYCVDGPVLAEGAIVFLCEI